MLSVVLRRLLGAIPTLFLLITISFAMVRAAPGGPFSTERALPPEVEHALQARYHLDEPLPKQYLRYLGGLLQGDLGPSFRYENRSVNDMIAQGLPVTARLGLLAMALALLVGVALGIVAAWRHHSALDRLFMLAAVIGISVPGFVLAPLFILFFAVWLHWLPAGGLGQGGIASMILPVLALALPQMAYIARLTRGAMMEVLRSPFMRTARAKGLGVRLILLRHALRPALIPVLSYAGPALAALLTGSVVVEQIFSLPGIGRFFVQGALNRDYTLVMGITIFTGVAIILMNLLVDLAYMALDPRLTTTHR
jgi:oligopeptide transport system permease protein